MEPDDLKSAWKALEQRLDRQRAVSLDLFTESRIQAARGRLLWFAVGKWLQVALAIGLSVFAATFWVAERAHPALLASGLALHAYGVALAIAGVMELLLVVRLRAARPVVTIQRYLAYLRVCRARIMPWLALSHWLLWVPAVLVLFRVLFGVDLGAERPIVVLTFLAAGALGLFATLWLLYAAPPRLRRRARAFAETTSTGAAIAAAEGLLDEVDRFAAE
jgi:hypothetical protein